MIAGKSSELSGKKPDTIPSRKERNHRRKRYCSDCHACRLLKSGILSSPETVSETLKRQGPSATSRRECIAGVLQERMGNSFTLAVLNSLDMPAGAVTKPIEPGGRVSRLHSGSAPGDKRAHEGASRQGQGKPLDHPIRSFMESRMGHFFGHVRVHTGSHAAESARNLSAHAYTIGHDIYFAPGKYRPDTTDGKRLLAHELAHVIQNKDLSARDDRQSPGCYSVSSPYDAQEHHADSAASAVMRGDNAPVNPMPSAIRQGIIFRKAEGEREEKGWLAGMLSEKMSEYASEVPGFTLVTYILGKNPITGSPVDRNARIFLKALFELVPGGEAHYKNLNEAGTIDQAFDWINQQISMLDITWDGIKSLISQAWVIVKEPSMPGTKIKKITELFSPVYLRIKNFCVELGKKVMSFVFEAVLKGLGIDVEKIMGVLKKAGDVANLIAADPVRFLKNLLAALGKGFNQFSDNIWQHLKEGLLGWLFGTLAKAGIEMPKSFDAKSMFGLVMQVLGITREFIHKKIAKVIGEKNVELIEKAWTFIYTLINSGISGLWDMIKDYIGNLKYMVVEAVQGWVVTKIVKAAITKLVSLFNPVGAIIVAVQTIYNTVMFFVERMNQILALVDAIVSSIASIAAGAIEKAANWIETTMARTLPVIISFLARLIGLGGISDEIRKIIQKLQGRVDKAVDKVINKVITKAKELLAKAKNIVGQFVSGKEEDPKKAEENKQIVIKLLREDLRKGIKGFKLWALMKYLKLKYRIKSLRIDKSNPGKYYMEIENSSVVRTPLESERKKEAKKSHIEEPGNATGEGGKSSDFRCVGKMMLTPYGAILKAFKGSPVIILSKRFRISDENWVRPELSQAKIRGGTGSERGSSTEAEVQSSGHVGIDEATAKGKSFEFDGGHLIGYRFLGPPSNIAANVAPQNPSLNRGAFSRIEKLLAQSPVTRDGIKDVSKGVALSVGVEYAPPAKLKTGVLKEQKIIMYPEGHKELPTEVEIPARVPKKWTVQAEVIKKNDKGKEYVLSTIEMEGMKGKFRALLGKDMGDDDNYTWYEEGYEGKRSAEDVKDQKKGKIGGEPKNTWVFESKTP